MEALRREELRVLRPGPAVEVAPSDPWTLRRPGHARWLGRVSYDDALEVQREAHARRIEDAEPDTLLLLEHESTYTSGSAADDGSFLVAPDELERAGHRVRKTTRGGDVTWHGPGQLVAYPIMSLADGRRDIHRYLRLLEEVLVRTCARFGVEAWRQDGRTGAWTSGGKIAAIGIRVARWTTLHGTALNVCPDLSRFDAIVPCGLSGITVTSLEREMGARLDVREVARVQAEEHARVFAIDWSAELGMST